MKTAAFTSRLLHLPAWQAWLLALASGALAPLSLAPFDIWPLGLLSLTLLALLLHGQAGRQAFLRALGFGLGFFGLGASWVFVSIHYHGGASAALAALLTLIFVGFLALVFSVPFYGLGRWFRYFHWSPLLAVPAVWLLGEWIRTWLLTGFPWLFLGYGHLDTWLAGWAPVTGVYGPGMILAITAGLLAQWLLHPGNTPGYPVSRLWMASLGVLLLWLGGAGLKQLSWTQEGPESVSVALVQPDIDQDVKWQGFYVQPTLKLLTDMSEDLWSHDWIIWPEAAVPLTYHEALPFLNRINQRADDTRTGLITGIIYDDPGQRRYYNSLAGFGQALGIYHKRRLVPFGEYVPLEDWLRGLIHFFDLPTSIISQGPWEQGGLQVGGISIAPAICYELAYPELMARSARNTQVLLNVSNLGWFGDSLGPPQFLQMGQMRALETGRPLIYSTNNGPSALIDSRGRVYARSGAFVAETLRGDVRPASGSTPFMYWGAWPLVILSVLILALSRGYMTRNR